MIVASNRRMEANRISASRGLSSVLGRDSEGEIGRVGTMIQVPSAVCNYVRASRILRRAGDGPELLTHEPEKGPNRRTKRPRTAATRAFQSISVYWSRVSNHASSGTLRI